MKVFYAKALKVVLDANMNTSILKWMEDKLNVILSASSAKDLYLAYSLLGVKINPSEKLDVSGFENKQLSNYLAVQEASVLEMARVYLLSEVLEANSTYFRSKVANLIQVADTSELETFLKYLILLPNPEDFKKVAVEALRTNIATVFNAISAGNPYPSEYFNDQQWNQMYLKAAFMQQDLSHILNIDKRANADLSRIISDYAHERWAASREVDPYFWRPVGGFLNDVLLQDMERLLQSVSVAENRAGALCCSKSEHVQASMLLNRYPKLKEDVATNKLTWNDVRHLKSQ